MKRGEKIELRKKGLSEVVTTVLLILLAIIAVLIIWQVIRNLASPDVDVSRLTVDLRISSASLAGDDLTVGVRRNSGEGNIVGIAFKVGNEEESRTYILNSSIKQLELQSYVFKISGINNPKIVSIAPIVRTAKGKDLVGMILDTKNITAGCIGSCAGKVCGDDGCGGSCGSCDAGKSCNQGVCQIVALQPNVKIDLLNPKVDTSIRRYSLFNLTLNVSCSQADCGNILVSLDPILLLYQENANEVSWTTMGGYDSPPWDVTGGGSLVVDGDWQTSNMETGGEGLTNPVYVFMNYTKPLEVIQNSLWQVKDGVGIINLTILPSCWNYNLNKILLSVDSKNNNPEPGGCSVNWKCYDGSWQVLRTVTTSVFQTCIDIYEEAVYWQLDVPEFGKNLVSITHGDIPFFTNATSNPWQISLNKDSSKEVIFWVNATGSTGIYSFFAYANLSSNLNVGGKTNIIKITVLPF